MKFNNNDIRLRFLVISDLHIIGKDRVTSHKLRKAYEKAKSLGHTDAFLFVGDITDFGLEEQIQEFYDITSECFDLKETQLIFSIGNHDLYNNELLGAPLTVGPDFKRIFGDYAYKGATAEDIEACNHHAVVNGVHFIALNAYKYSGGVDFHEKDLIWFENEIKEAESSEKNTPIFVCAHPMIVGTCYGSNYGGETGGYWASSKLYSILMNHPRTVYFGGHLHFPLQNELSIWQNEFTAICTSSVYFASIEAETEDGVPYLDISSGSEPKEAHEYSQGLLVEVDNDGNTRLNRIDFYNNKTIKEPWFIPTPKDNLSHLLPYRNDVRIKNSTAPVFSADACITESIKNNDPVLPMYEITFTAAEDADMVKGYYIEYISADDNSVLKRFALYSDFFRADSGRNMAKVITKQLAIGKLKPFSPFQKEPYYIRLTAFNCYGKNSEPIVSTIIKNSDYENIDPYLDINPGTTTPFLDFSEYSVGNELIYNKDYNTWPPFERGDGAHHLTAEKDGKLSMILRSGCYQLYRFTKKQPVDASGCNQIQIWVDLNEINFNRLSFTLYSNDVAYTPDDLNNYDMKAYIQEADGWKSVPFSFDGTLEYFGSCCGYIRFPVRYLYNKANDKTIPLDSVDGFQLLFYGGDDCKDKKIEIGNIEFIN
ncbi:MAG: hypothetical protein A2Y17_01330 [Clostridiales bacterium GWF2_38_85]|nr:MAG: hypothetical protein A2Y17_01330 [Clostridiales bacterium GWF2_38_85]